MNVKKHIEAIETLCEAMRTAPAAERITRYTAIKQLIDDVRAHVAMCKEDNEIIDHNSSNIYFTTLISHLRCLAGLEENTFTDDDQFLWIMTEIGRLKHPCCFDF